MKRLLALLVLVPLLAAGCGQVPTAVPVGQSPLPTPESYPPPTERGPLVTPTPRPTRTPQPTPEPLPTPLPTWTPLVGQPTPYAPAETLPADFPAVVYFVQRPDAPPQIRTLRYEQGLLQEELTAELSPAALLGKEVDPYIGFGWVYQLSASPDGRRIAASFRGEGSYVATLVLGTDGDMYVPHLPGVGGVGFLAWIPGTERVLVTDWGNWGTVTGDDTDFILFPSYNVKEAVVSLDGSKAVFSAVPSEGIWLGSIDVNGCDPTALPVPDSYAGSQARNLELSPDGRTLGFTWDLKVRLYPGTGPIWLINADGSNLRLLGPGNTDDFHLDWSPDGRTIAFARWENTEIALPEPYNLDIVVSSLWFMDVGSGQERLLLSSEGHYANWSPKWLPDGSGLVFLSDRGGEVNVWFIRRDGTGLQQLTRQGGLVGEIAVLP